MDTYLFSPAEADRERHAQRAAKRKTPKSCGNVGGSNRVETPRKKPGEFYTSDSYRRAIVYACDKAGVPRWHPRQLRHTAAPIIRRDFGLEAG